MGARPQDLTVLKEVDRRHAYSLITAWSFLRHRRVDPNRDPNAETTGQHRADTVDRPLSRKHAKAPESVAAQRFPALIVSSHAGGHWFESSSLHQKVPDFVRNQELFSVYDLKSNAASWRFSHDPNRDPKADRSGKHRRGADGIIRPSRTIFGGYMVWLMTLPMVSAAERFITSVAWV